LQSLVDAGIETSSAASENLRNRMGCILMVSAGQSIALWIGHRDSTTN
jgi:hypothetical protein